MTRWRTRLRGPSHDRGAAAVEFAIVLTVLLLIIFAIIDFGRLLFASQAVKSASREGARTAVIQTADSAEVNAAIDNAGGAGAALAGGGAIAKYWQLNWTPGNAMTVAIPNPDPPVVSLCTSATKGQPLSVQVSTPFTWFTPVRFFAQTVNEVRSTTTMRCE